MFCYPDIDDGSQGALSYQKRDIMTSLITSMIILGVGFVPRLP